MRRMTKRRMTRNIAAMLAAAAALAGGAALAGAACGGGPAAAAGDGPAPALTPPRIVPLADLAVLETSGPPPRDTSVTFPANTRRIILLQHGAPDRTPFAELTFPAGAFGADPGRRVTVTVAVRPGVYGLEVGSDTPWRGGPVAPLVRFKYPVHFEAPAGVRGTYGGNEDFARALAIGLVRPDSSVALLPSIRPALDNLEAAMPGPGRYLVAAPK
jgi:hypothetical protein